MTSLPDNSSLDLLRRLARLNRRARWIGLLRGAGQTAVVAVVCLAAGMLLDLLVEAPTKARFAMLAGVILVVGIVAWRTVVRAGFSRPSDAELAAVVERHYPQLGERLTSAVEIQAGSVADRYAGSAYMRALLERDARTSSENLDFLAAISSRRAARWAVSGAAGLLGILLPFAIAGNDYALLWARFFKPWEQQERFAALDTIIDQAAGEVTVVPSEIENPPSPNAAALPPDTPQPESPEPPPQVESDTVARRHDQLKQRLIAIRKEVERQRDEVSQLIRHSESDEPADGGMPPRESWTRLVREESDISNRLLDLAFELAERPLFARLANDARNVAEKEIRAASQRLAGADNSPSAERARASSEAGDHLTTARDQLAEMERRFDELAAAERDLLHLPQLVHRAERLAGQTRALAHHKQNSAKVKDSATPSPDEPQPADPLHPLRQERDNLARDVQSLFDKHAALLDTARRIQIDRLAEFARQLESLAAREEKFAQAIEEDATEIPAETAKSPKPIPGGTSPPGQDHQTVIEQLQVDLQLQVRQATRAATAILDRSGGDAPAARDAVELARRVDAAAQETWAGRLAQGIDFSVQAGKLARNLVATLRADEDFAALAPAAKTLEMLAERLEQIGSALSPLAASPAERRAARVSGQRMLAQQTRNVEQGLTQIAASLSQEPLRLETVGESAHQAQLASSAAYAGIQKSVESMELGERLNALNAAQGAARELSEAARWAREGAAAGQGIPGSSPEEIAGPLAEAAQHLQQAKENLNRNRQSENAPAGDRSAANSDSARNDERDRAREESLARSAESLDRSARALADAANNTKRGGVPQQGNDSRSASGASSEMTTLSGSAGTGAWGLRDVESLTEKLHTAELRKSAAGQWGRLQPQPRTQIHEPGGTAPRGEYTDAVRRYFRELAAPQK